MGVPVLGRQEVREGRSPVGGGLDIDDSAVRLEDGGHRGQAQTGALIRGLGGIDRLEDGIAHGALHAATVVAHPQLHTLLPGRRFSILGRQEQASALGHGIAGVGHQVQDKLLDLLLVRPSGPQSRIQRQGQGDALPQGLLPETFPRHQEVIQVRRDSLVCRPARQMAQMPHQGEKRLAPG